MTVYFVVNSTITDMDLLNQYMVATGPTLAGREVQILAATNDAEVLEGESAGSRVVILGFPDKAAFDDWYHSPGYQEVVGMRLQATTGFGLLAEGFVMPGA